jgi:transcriptional regulator with XRE-family HTH domain
MMSRVKEFREAKGLTQCQLARLVDVDISTIRNWESGRSGLSVIVRVGRLSEVLGVEPLDLVEERGHVEV